MILKVIKSFPFFPIIFAFIAILSFYFANYYETPLIALLVSSLLSLLLVFIFWVISYFLIRDFQKSAIFVFVFSALFFSFQNIVNIFRRLSLQKNNIDLFLFWIKGGGQTFILVLLFLLIITFYILIKKSKKISSYIILYLNIFSVLLLLSILLQGFLVINKNNNERQSFFTHLDNQAILHEKAKPIINNKQPDIYYIILDAFARSDTLQELYQLDNTKFINDLQTRGFYVAEDSYANYSQTRSSLASSLNMMYLDKTAAAIQSDKSYYYPAYYLIRNSEVQKTLRTIGYELVSIMSEVSFTDFPEWDTYLELSYIPNRFTQTFISSTALSIFINPQLYSWHRATVNYAFDTIPEVAKLEGSQFLFAHITCPHPPFVFNADGSSVPVDRLYSTLDTDGYLSVGTPEEYKSGYRNQVNYLQEKIIFMIDEIARNSKDPFIIILQGDHGPGLEVNQMNIESSNVKERLAILNAIYFSDQDYESLYPQISPVNTFRVVFSKYLGISKPLLNDNHYVSNFHTLFDFVLVDDQLQ